MISNSLEETQFPKFAPVNAVAVDSPYFEHSREIVRDSAFDLVNHKILLQKLACMNVLYSPRNNPQPRNDPQIDPEMIPVFFHADPQNDPQVILELAFKPRDCGVIKINDLGSFRG